MNIFKKIFGNSHNDIQEETKMTNTQKALELINTFATGDTAKATELLAEGYIQHNLAYGTGRDAFVGSVAYLASAPVKTTVNMGMFFGISCRTLSPLKTIFSLWFGFSSDIIAWIASVVSLPSSKNFRIRIVWSWDGVASFRSISSTTSR